MKMHGQITLQITSATDLEALRRLFPPGYGADVRPEVIPSPWPPDGRKSPDTAPMGKPVLAWGRYTSEGKWHWTRAWRMAGGWEVVAGGLVKLLDVAAWIDLPADLHNPHMTEPL